MYLHESTESIFLTNALVPNLYSGNFVPFISSDWTRVTIYGRRRHAPTYVCLPVARFRFYAIAFIFRTSRRTLVLIGTAGRTRRLA